MIPLPVARPGGVPPAWAGRSAVRRPGFRAGFVLLLAFAAAFRCGGVRAEDDVSSAPSAAENDLFNRINYRLFRNLPPELLENNAILNPDYALSTVKAQRLPASLPTGPGQWNTFGRVRVPNGYLFVPVPDGSEELPGSSSAVWYSDHLRIRVDSSLPDLTKPFDWNEALPREYHMSSLGQQTVAERLADSVKLKFDEINAGDRFNVWLEIFQADAGELTRPRLSFADRVAIVYRLYKKAIAPKDAKHYANGQIRCLVSLPAVEEQVHRRTGEREARWNATAFVAPPEGGPLIRITFSEPQIERRTLTEGVVLNALANCRWESAEPKSN